MNNYSSENEDGQQMERGGKEGMRGSQQSSIITELKTDKQ